MFGSLSARRFPKARIDDTKVGPGTYEVSSSLDDRSLLIMNNSDRYDGNSSVCESSFSYSQIFVDDLENEKPVRTPRTGAGSARQPFGRSTKENVVCDGQKPCLTPRKPKLDMGNANAGSRTPGRAEKAKDISVAELQRRVEDLQTEATTAKRIIENLVTERSELTKAIPAESAGELLGLREKLQSAHVEKERLLEQLEIATSRERVLEAAGKPVNAPQALERLVAELVDQELLDARKVLGLQREAWNQETEQLQQQWEKLERQLDRSSQESVAAKAKVAAAEQVAEQCNVELGRLREEADSSQCEVQSLRQLAGSLQQQLKQQQQHTISVEQALDVSQLEEQRLQEVVKVSEDAMERYMEREAKMAGHANHKQKIQMTLQLKQDNVALRAEVQNLQKKLHHLQYKSHQRLSGVALQAAPPSPGMASLLELEPLAQSPGTLLVKELESAEDEVAAESHCESKEVVPLEEAFGHCEEVW